MVPQTDTYRNARGSADLVGEMTGLEALP